MRPFLDAMKLVARAHSFAAETGHQDENALTQVYRLLHHLYPDASSDECEKVARGYLGVVVDRPCSLYVYSFSTPTEAWEAANAERNNLRYASYCEVRKEEKGGYELNILIRERAQH